MHIRPRILDLLFVLDWMMTLPEHLSKALWQNIHELKQEKTMAYVSTFERFASDAGWQKGVQEGLQKGLQEGRQEGRQEGLQKGEVLALQRLLTKRFGPVQADLIATIEAASLSQIETWFDRAITADSLAAVFGEPEGSI